MKAEKQNSRRQFIKQMGILGAVVGFPTIIPASALGRNGYVAPSNRITMATIGCGGMGTYNTGCFLGKSDVQFLAVCDVLKWTDKLGSWHTSTEGWEPLKNRIEEHYGKASGKKYTCDVYTDYRELLQRKDIDAVTIALPDHWHALVYTTAARSGKDVYGEKPLTRYIKEGRAVVNAVREYGRVWQTGSWQRSVGQYYKACGLVQNGAIGKVHTINVGIPKNPYMAAVPPEPIPEGFDWEFWQGPAARADFSIHRAFYTWRFNNAYSNGQISDWGAHNIDIAHWGMGYDKTKIGPKSVRPILEEMEWYEDGLFNQPKAIKIELIYPDGVKMYVSDSFNCGTEFIGEKGKIYVDRSSASFSPKSLERIEIPANGEHIYHSTDHYQNFIDCVKNRRRTITDVEIAHRTNTSCLLCEISYRIGRKIEWDAGKETFANNDTEAENYLMGAYHAPWVL